MAKSKKTILKETIKLLKKKEENSLNQIVAGRKLIALFEKELKTNS